MRMVVFRINCWIGLRCSLGDDWAACAYCEEDGWRVDVAIGIAGDSTGVREEASGEVIPESLLRVLSRFWRFDGMERNGSMGMGKNHALL